MDDKVRINRLRRAADRQRLRLTRSRRRDPRAVDFDGWMIIDLDTNGILAGGHPYAYSLSIDDVEDFLNSGDL